MTEKLRRWALVNMGGDTIDDHGQEADMFALVIVDVADAATYGVVVTGPKDMTVASALAALRASEVFIARAQGATPESLRKLGCVGGAALAPTAAEDRGKGTLQ